MLYGSVLLLLLGMYAWLAPQTASRSDSDWHHLWLGGRMIVEGRAANLYDPAAQIEVYRRANLGQPPPRSAKQRYRTLGLFNYPPPAALYYAAFAWLPVSVAGVAHAYWTIGLALAIAGLMARAWGDRISWVVVAIAVLAYPPFFMNLSLGQNALATLAVLAGAWCLCSRGRDLAAGLLLALLICKPNWLLAVGWIPLVHRRWRLLLGMALGTLAVLAGAVLVAGLQPFRDYAQLFGKVASLHALPGYHLDLKYNALALFRRWTGTGISADVLGWSSVVLVIVATARTTRGCWKPGTSSFHTMMASGLMAGLWVNPHLNYYDLMATAPCAIVLAVEANRSHGIARWVALTIVALAYVAVPWDRAWSWSGVLPVPSLAILALWASLGWWAWSGQTNAEFHRAGDGDLSPSVTPGPGHSQPVGA